MDGISTQREPSSPPTSNQHQSPQDGQSFSGSLKPNQVGETSLYGVPIVSLVIDGQERLCLAQISNTLLKSYSYNEIHNRRVALGITCVQCTPVQLEILRRAGAMPISSRRCGMITKREAERLCKSFLGEHRPPKLPENFAFDVVHECAWGCRGSFIPARYNSSRAKCIKCGYCGLYFSPNKFIFHSHRTPDSKYTQPDAANFNSWRRHLRLSDPAASEDLAHSWEDVKAMFNGGTRKRAFPSPASSRPHLAAQPPPPPAKSLRGAGGAEEEPGAQAARSFPLIPVPSKGFSGVLHKMAPPLFPPPPYGFPAFGLCAKKDDGLGEAGKAAAAGLPGVFWPTAPASKDSVYPPFPVFWPAAGALPVPSYPGLSQAAAKAGDSEEAEPGGDSAEEQGRAPEEDRPGEDEGRPGEPLTPRKLRYISAFRPVVKAAESLAKLYGSREVYGARPPGYSSPDLLSDTSSYRSASPGQDTEPEVDVESGRFPEEEGGEEESGPAGGLAAAAAPSSSTASSPGSEDRREQSPGTSPASPGGYEVYTKQVTDVTQTMKGNSSHQSLPNSYLCNLDPNEQDSEDSHSTTEDVESRKPFQDQRSHISHTSPLHTDRGEEDSPIDVTGTQFVEKDIENMAKDELQKLLVEQMDLRKKLEREFQSLKDNFQDQMKRELAYREEMVQQLQIVRDTLCNELDQERKARYAIQQKLKDADTKTLHRELFLQSSTPAPLSYIWAPRKLMYPPAP
ncbi:SKI family transcriptional corepressor 1 [Pelobates cultripes]|uniref:SKI family transcriptional corepressor 1 n=1 Tax=Pelobates cultripes TaxID=61616 RepID=A0AAD1RMV7_PELCU|nr:SKI family transcriptional corepressor 1 [Pelobates cultripes]